MRPRTVRRPANSPALKKRPPPKTVPIETKEEEEENPRRLQTIEEKKPSLLPSLNEAPRDPSSSPKDEDEYAAPIDHEIDGSERLDLDDNDPQSEADDDGVTDRGNRHAERNEDMEDEGEDDGQDAADDMMEDEMEDEEDEEEDVEDEGHDREYEEEHHEVVQERRKRKEFEVFVGGLDRDATEEDLWKVFSQVGEVTEVRLMRNPATQKNKGFAFLRFATVEQARRALNELKHPTVNGKQCGVAPSQDSDTLFVGNICKTWSKETLKEKLAKYGVIKYEDITLVEDTKNEGMNRGFAFIDFSSRLDALDACKRLQKRDVIFGTDRTAKVAFADTFIEPDAEIMAQVKTVFIDGLPAAWDEDRVKDTLRKFGKIEKVELARNMPAAKRTDFGFVTFDTHDNAVACVDGINNTELGDGEKKVKVRARLSRPRQRSRLGKHARGGYSIGHIVSRGVRSSWGLSVPRVDTYRLSGRSGRDIPSRSTYVGSLKRPLDTRDRHLIVDEVPDRIGSRRRFLPPERAFDRRSPVSAYGKVSSKRDYVRHDEPLTRSSDFATRVVTGRRSRDAYASRGSDYLYSPPKTGSRSAARRLPPYEEETYVRRIERPSSYRDGHSREYSSISGTKRPHSAVDDLHPQYVESVNRHSRARYEYGGSGSGLHYSDSAYYGTESTRLGRGSHLGYEGSSRSSAGHSRGMYETSTSSMGYSRGAGSRGDGGGMYSGYGRDYVSGDDLGAGSYSSLYSSRGMGDGYFSGRGSGQYY